jgi:hypothetical protein
MMYRLAPDGTHAPIHSMDGVAPHGMCQPPVNARELVKELSLEELRRVMNTMIIWAPDLFEFGLYRVSEDRQIHAKVRAEIEDIGGRP